MAGRINSEEIYNGSAAYDLYAYPGSAAPEIQRPGLPEEQPQPQKKRRVKVKAAIAPVAVVGLTVVACMLILVIFGYVQLYEATERVSSLQSELESLKSEQVILESLYENGIDLPYIEERAAELGFSTPAANQTVYINLSGTDRAEIYSAEKTGWIERILRAIESSARGLVEYLS